MIEIGLRQHDAELILRKLEELRTTPAPTLEELNITRRRVDDLEADAHQHDAEVILEKYRAFRGGHGRRWRQM